MATINNSFTKLSAVILASATLLVAISACLAAFSPNPQLANTGKKVSASDLFNLDPQRQLQPQQQAQTAAGRSLIADSVGQQQQQQQDTCGYAKCPELSSSKINVHLVPHSHDDVGWLKTVDQYYYGTQKKYSQFSVQHILDSIMPQLIMDESKRFVYVEMSFFSKWWNEQTEQMKSIVKRLVNEGRLEFINGGWCMNDEATVNYQSTIEQMTLGLKFLNDNFGKCAQPKVGWQIDPFGHTNEQASLFAQFGFDGMYFSRIGYRDKAARIANKSLDLIWHGDRLLAGQDGSIFTNIFIEGYDSPSGFCFDVFCFDDELVDNRKSYEYNVDKKAKKFIEYIRRYAEAKLTSQVMITMGGDFHFSAAGQNFKNLDKLIKYIKSTNNDINLFYSTPSCYQLAVYKETRDKGIRLPEKYDDFLPYDSSSTVWWSGFFSSRPSVKLVEREVADLLQVSRVISFANLLKPAANKRWLDDLRDHENKCLQPLWEILGDLQHHDAVTGTEKQHVADDYVRRSSDATSLCSKFIGDLRRSKLNEYLKKSGQKYDQLREVGKRFKLDPVFLESTTLCPLLNISQCDPIEAEIDYKQYLLSINQQPTGNQNISNSNKNGSDSERQPRAPQSTSSSSLSFRQADIPAELMTKSVLLNVYNPLSRPISQYDIRLPCNGRCNLENIHVTHLSTNETMKIIRLPIAAGIHTLPFRDSITNYEILFYANVPALGYTSFIIEDSNSEDIVEDELESGEQSPELAEQTRSASSTPINISRGPTRGRRIRRDVVATNTTKTSIIDFNNNNGTTNDTIALAKDKFIYFEMKAFEGKPAPRNKRDLNNPSSTPPALSSSADSSPAERVIVKFDMHSGMIVGLRRVSDGSLLNITQKFGYYFPANDKAQPGAYTFRPNTSEPYLLDKPILYKMYKRKNGALIEIHQKWSDWLWQTIRVDAKKNYIEFDYVVGPIPLVNYAIGREVVTRYISNMSHNGVFMTDSNGRQLMSRRRLKTREPEQLGGSFYPVVSTLMLKNLSNSTRPSKNSADLLAILVDRAQAGTSLNEGQLELLIHRRQTVDDNWGVGEALNEPGEDGRGLVTRGRHRLYLKFPDFPDPKADLDLLKDTKSQLFKLAETPLANLDYEINFAKTRNNTPAVSKSTFIVRDQVYDELSRESRKLAMKPVLTFDRLRVSASDFITMMGFDGNSKIKADLSLLNNTLPENVHLLTLQPWSARTQNEILIRLENLDNPLTIHPQPDHEAYNSLLRHYKATSEYFERDADENWDSQLRSTTVVDIEFLIKRVRIVALEETTLGANVNLKEASRLNFTEEANTYRNLDESESVRPNSVSLSPRQIRSFLARIEVLN